MSFSNQSWPKLLSPICNNIASYNSVGNSFVKAVNPNYPMNFTGSSMKLIWPKDQMLVNAGPVQTWSTRISYQEDCWMLRQLSSTDLTHCNRSSSSSMDHSLETLNIMSTVNSVHEFFTWALQVCRSPPVLSFLFIWALFCLLMNLFLMTLIPVTTG